MSALMYPHVKQFETRRQELEQRFGSAEAPTGARAAARAPRHRLTVAASVLMRRLAAIRS